MVSPPSYPNLFPRSFADKDTGRLFRDGVCPARLRNIEAVVLRKLDMVDAAIRLDDLLSPRVTGWKRWKAIVAGSIPFVSTDSGVSVSAGRPTVPRR
jgi:hypothetical protein